MIIRTVQKQATFTFDSYKHCKSVDEDYPIGFFLFTNGLMVFFAICPIVNIFVLREIILKD
jgi:hypothetical protein